MHILILGEPGVGKSMFAELIHKYAVQMKRLVSINSMKSFLSYRCPNNVGQLETDIQLACAKAYADLVSNKKDAIKINSVDLPGYIREGLYSETAHRQLWNKLIDINKRYCIFDSSAEKILFEEDEDNIYDMIDLRVHELKSQGAGNDQLEQQMVKEINEYFSAYLGTVNQNTSLAIWKALSARMCCTWWKKLLNSAKTACKKLLVKPSTRAWRFISPIPLSALSSIKKL
jgi:transcriptional regulator with AAA-type ATPase domain